MDQGAVSKTKPRPEYSYSPRVYRDRILSIGSSRDLTWERKESGRHQQSGPQHDEGSERTIVTRIVSNR